MKNIFPLQCILGVFLCSTWLLIGMDGEQTNPSPRGEKVLTTNQSRSSVFTRQETDQIKLENVKLVNQFTESQTALEGLRKFNAQLNTEKEDLSGQMKTLNQQLEDKKQSEERLLEERIKLLSSIQREIQLKEMAIQEKVDLCTRMRVSSDNHETFSSKKNAEIKELAAKLQSEQQLYQDVSQALTSLNSEHVQVLHYKKIFLGAFITCALALIAHILYMHHESMGISPDLLASFKEQFSYFSAGTSQSA